MVASRKYIKFLFEFAVRGHPKQDGKYEFQDWHPVMMIMIMMIQKFIAVSSARDGKRSGRGDAHDF